MTKTPLIIIQTFIYKTQPPRGLVCFNLCRPLKDDRKSGSQAETRNRAPSSGAPHWRGKAEAGRWPVSEHRGAAHQAGQTAPPARVTPATAFTHAPALRAPGRGIELAVFLSFILCTSVLVILGCLRKYPRHSPKGWEIQNAAASLIGLLLAFPFYWSVLHRPAGLILVCLYTHVTNPDHPLITSPFSSISFLFCNGFPSDFYIPLPRLILLSPTFLL